LRIDVFIAGFELDTTAVVGNPLNLGVSIAYTAADPANRIYTTAIVTSGNLGGGITFFKLAVTTNTINLNVNF
jgi:hypothetical protein